MLKECWRCKWWVETYQVHGTCHYYPRIRQKRATEHGCSKFKPDPEQEKENS